MAEVSSYSLALELSRSAAAGSSYALPAARHKPARHRSPQTTKLTRAGTVPTSVHQVPTVAVENVYIWNNTSLVQDEVLSQRLGLVPLKIDPRKIEFKDRRSRPTSRLRAVVSSFAAVDVGDRADQ